MTSNDPIEVVGILNNEAYEKMGWEERGLFTYVTDSDYDYINFLEWALWDSDDNGVFCDDATGEPTETVEECVRRRFKTLVEQLTKLCNAPNE